MKVLFDTSVLVPAFVDQLSNHPAAFGAFAFYTSGERMGFCSTHALAEAYSVLTSLPPPNRGLTGGIIYDALHLEAARKAGCARIYTYNLAHFRALRASEEDLLESSP